MSEGRSEMDGHIDNIRGPMHNNETAAAGLCGGKHRMSMATDLIFEEVCTSLHKALDLCASYIRLHAHSAFEYVAPASPETLWR